MAGGALPTGKGGLELKIAIVGTGVSGLVAAHLLHSRHEITVFEADVRIGGHIHTVDARIGDRSWAVDTGFIVFNETTYPNFNRLLDSLGIDSLPSQMSFGVRCDRSGLEYGSRSFNSIFAQRRNLLRGEFHRMLFDILRFQRQGRTLIRMPDEKVTLREMLAAANYSDAFVEHYLVPLGASIWSATPGRILDFPAHAFVSFLANHGLLRVYRQLRWRVIRGGSRRYVNKITERFRDRIRLESPVTHVERLSEGVRVRSRHGVESFDRVVLATHSDQALALLADPSPVEREILGAIDYQKNEAVLHTDDKLMPREARARTSWNYLLPDPRQRRLIVTYDMNRLQGLKSPEPLLVTLNPQGRVRSEHIMHRMTYAHPVYTPQAIAAQRLHGEIDGQRGTYFCGAYWGYGFHEDGVNSALEVCRKLGVDLH